MHLSFLVVPPTGPLELLLLCYQSPRQDYTQTDSLKMHYIECLLLVKGHLQELCGWHYYHSSLPVPIFLVPVCLKSCVALVLPLQVLLLLVLISREISRISCQFHFSHIAKLIYEQYHSMSVILRDDFPHGTGCMEFDNGKYVHKYVLGVPTRLLVKVAMR